MLRDKNLVALSRQHHHALALCVRIERSVQAAEVDLPAWQAEIQQSFEQEIAVHFAAEEKELFPVAARFPELRGLVEELLAEHGALRDFFASAASRTLDAAGLERFAKALSTHIRKEERQLFEGLQQRMNGLELAALGPALDAVLANASEACILPSAATRLRPKS
jgi:hemerythrin-like domain-containing protein